MLRQLARCALVAAMSTAVSACLYETTLDASGGGVMSIMLRGTKRQDLEGLKTKMQSAAVTVTSAEYSGDGDASQAFFTLRFDDITKLSTTEFFRKVTVTRSGGAEGSQVLTATVRNSRPSNLSDESLERLGKEVKIVVTFPGTVIEANGTVSGRTVVWTWGMKEYFNLKELVMTAAFKPSQAGANATAAPEVTPPA